VTEAAAWGPPGVHSSVRPSSFSHRRDVSRSGNSATAPASRCILQLRDLGTQRKKYDEEIKQLENDLYKATNDEAAAKQALEQRGKDVEAAIYAIDKCITYRKAVLNVFASSLDKMRNEKETPEIEAVAYSLKSKYDAAKSGHQRQITTREDAMSICKKARP
jgi:chromosome segregation ATPase